MSASVTRILRAVGMTPAFAGVPTAIMDAAKARGTAVHLACQLDDENDLDESSLDDGTRAYLHQYRTWKVFNKSQLIWWEKRLHHPRMPYNGQPDLFHWVSAARTLTDFKTSEDEDPCTVIQLAAYRELINECWCPGNETGPVQSVMSLHLRKDSLPRVHVYTEAELRDAWHDFVGALRVYEFRRQHERLGVEY